MRRVLSVFALMLALCAFAPRAQALVVVTVDKTAQRLTVAVDGVVRHQWPVSTARWGYRTPNGTYRPERLERQWFSRKYDWSPMPHSIFFHGGYAIHGSNEISRLGRPASHGCIRLHPNNAATLFNLVQGRTASTRIVITGEGADPLVARNAPPRAMRQQALNDGPYELQVSPRRRHRAEPVYESFEEVFEGPRRNRGRW